MSDEPLARILRERLALANASPRCGARRRDGETCRGAAMANGRCRMHGGPSTGPRTPEGLERSRRSNWKHGYYSAKAKRVRREARRQLSAASAADRGRERGRRSRPHQLDVRRGAALRVICTCECRKTAEVESGVASAGVAAGGSRNSEREPWGFLGPYRDPRPPRSSRVSVNGTPGRGAAMPRAAAGCTAAILPLVG